MYIVFLFTLCFVATTHINWRVANSLLKDHKGSQDKVIHPNSELANKRVLISHKFHFEQLGEQETAGMMKCYELDQL